MIAEGQAAICATPGVVVSTTEKAMAVPGDFGLFLKPGPFLTSEEADNMDGIGTIRIRLEEVQDQVNSNTAMHAHTFYKKKFGYKIAESKQCRFDYLKNHAEYVNQSNQMYSFSYEAIHVQL